MYKRKTFKVSSLLLVVCMLVQLIGVQVSAATQEKVYDSLDMKITFKLVSSWDGGYNAEISINNPTDASYEDWALEMVTGDTIANIWNAGIEKNEDGKLLVTNLGYNQDVKAGKTVTFGYTASTSFTEYPEIKALKKQYVKADASKYSVDYKVISDWGSGANAEIAVTNKSDAHMAEWKLTFAYAGEITNIWNAKILSHENGVYVIAGNDYNQNLNAGATVTAGFSIGSGSKDLTVSDAVLEEYGYASEEEIIDDHEIIDELIAFSNTDEVYINGHSETVYIYAICEDYTKTVNLYEEKLGLIGVMKDDGKFAESGDDMSGDGIVSAKYEIPVTAKKGKLSFYATDGDKKSNSVQIDVYVALTSEQIAEMEYVDEVVKAASAAAETNEEKYDAVKKICDELLENGKIESFTQSDDKSNIIIKYNSGLLWVIEFVPFSEYTNGKNSKLPIDNYQLNNVSDNLDNIILEPIEIISQYLEDIDFIEPVSAAFINTCAASRFTSDPLSPMVYQENAYKSIYETVESKGVNVTPYPMCTVYDLYDKGNNILAGKNIICIMGHGCVFDSADHPLNKPVICCANEDYNYSKYSYLLDTDAIIHRSTEVFGLSADGYYATPKFFEKHIGSIEDSFVSLIICSSYGNTPNTDTSLAKAFCTSGANTVTCYANSVDTTHALNQLTIYLAGLLARGTSWEAYTLAKNKFGYENSDGYSNGSYYELYEGSGSGSGTSTTIKNGNFEVLDGDKPAAWINNGDVRSIPYMGTTTAHNRYMAFISTGVGSQNGSAGTEGSSISQIVTCKNKKLSFYYDVFSEEPMEWVGSSYDDKFVIEIRDLYGNLLHSEVLESINTSTWIPCASLPEVNFADGDNTAYHTYLGLRYKEIVLPSSCMNKPIIISFIVCDVGDSAYDTAAVIDDIKLSN